MGFATIVTLSHALTLLWVQRNQNVPIGIREKVWHRHIIVNGNLWRLLFLWVVGAQIYFFQKVSPNAFSFGIFLVGIGLWLVVSSYLRLGGFEMAMGKRFFFPEKNTEWLNIGIYTYLKNPMYDGFVLLLVGFGMLFGAIEDYYLAITIFVLFNGILAFIESRGNHYRII